MLTVMNMMRVVPVISHIWREGVYFTPDLKNLTHHHLSSQQMLHKTHLIGNLYLRKSLKFFMFSQNIDFNSLQVEDVVFHFFSDCTIRLVDHLKW